MTEDEEGRRWLFSFLEGKGPDYLYCVVRSWNWSNGTWLLAWIAAQPSCPRATAQLIFWGCEPAQFLPAQDPTAYTGDTREVYDLAALVVRNWRAGRYPPHRTSWWNRIRSLFDTTYAPDQIGYYDPENPVPRLASYRTEEARWPPDQRPWVVPDDLGQVQIARVPDWDLYNLTEGFPDEFVERMERLHGQG